MIKTAKKTKNTIFFGKISLASNIIFNYNRKPWLK